MAYSSEISRRNPGLFLFLIDQSRSMSHKLGGTLRSKSQEAADAINRQIYELIYRCTKSDGVRDYFDIGIIGYGAVSDSADSLLKDETIVPISKLAENPLRMEKRTEKISDPDGNEVETEFEFPVWFEPVANSNTPMVKGLKLAQEWLDDWLAEHHDSYPPVVINISDGAATDGDPLEIAKAIISMSTQDGNVLFWNCHLSELKGQKPVAFPADSTVLPSNEKFATQLFEMSSELPDSFLNLAQERALDVQPGSRAYVFNAGLDELLELLDIGTRAPTENLQ
ncbi:MAG: VWA domain-containing protein [Candidatus Thermoplasmatota archaeon]|nr:VWA domain-containing protein [Candidatus Thermoplasmatota archaeon]